jgi:hypothetical protein
MIYFRRRSNNLIWSAELKLSQQEQQCVYVLEMREREREIMRVCGPSACPSSTASCPRAGENLYRDARTYRARNIILVVGGVRGFEAADEGTDLGRRHLWKQKNRANCKTLIKHEVPLPQHGRPNGPSGRQQPQGCRGPARGRCRGPTADWWRQP